MLGRWPNTQLYKYPRMSDADTNLWRLWFAKYGIAYDRYDYDYPVGSGVDPGPDYSELLRKDYIELTRKRIDAIGYTGNQATIFEIKPRAGTTALGQLLTYKRLFTAQYKEFPVVNLSVITGLMTDEEKEIYSAHNIQIFVV